MSHPAALPPSPGIAIRGTRYPLVLPSVRDPRLHLAAVITSLQVLGQVAFDFRLSIAQILVSLVTCAVLEVAITLRQQRVIMWPASALLTGNSVAFILRVPGTEHGDWWSTTGWWVFAAAAAASLLSKYLIRIRGRHVFNPSNVGLVLCFLALGPELADPLDFWWGPMSPSLALALAIIVVGGIVILARLALLAMAVSFWIVFVGAVAVVAATGHSMTARWHLGPVTGVDLWAILATSPEILVFLFFMLTDPRTVPAGKRGRVVFGVSVALVAALLVALAPTEFWAKVGVLAALTLVCAARPALAAVMPSTHPGPRRLAALAAAGLVAYTLVLSATSLEAQSDSALPQRASHVVPLPRVAIRPSRGVDSDLDSRTAMHIARDLAAGLQEPGSSRVRRITLWLQAGSGQFPTIMARLEGASRVQTVEVAFSASGYRIDRVRHSQPAAG